jgi:hypothetical protein
MEDIDWLKVAELELKNCEENLEMAHLINDTLEGIYGTKSKPSEEWDGSV